MAYAPFRFFLDFLRADQVAKRVIPTPDARYAGLTPAQWFCIAFFMAGIYLVFFRKPKPEDAIYKKNSDRLAREKAEADKDSPARAKPGESSKSAGSAGSSEQDRHTDA
jgi:phosphatidylglycerol:prolipoprotein diacylglycerol transferase